MEGVLLGIRDNKNRALKIRLGYQSDETSQTSYKRRSLGGGVMGTRPVICVNNFEVNKELEKTKEYKVELSINSS